MNLRNRPYYLCIAALTLAAATTAADLVVIDLQNRTAEEVLPVIRPMAGAAALSGADYKLFVRGEAAEVTRIRQILAVLDRPPQQLLISVRYSGTPLSSDSNVGSAATGSEVVLNGRAIRSTGADTAVSSVRVLEGNGAHVSTGQSVPVVAAVLLSPATRKRGATTGITTDYREFTTGFDVVPRVNGERVLLEISAQQQRPGSGGTSNAVAQRTATTVSGKLGDWIDLGGVADSMNEQQLTVGISGATHRVTTRSDQRSIAVKVEKAD